MDFETKRFLSTRKYQNKDVKKIGEDYVTVKHEVESRLMSIIHKCIQIEFKQQLQFQTHFL